MSCVRNDTKSTRSTCIGGRGYAVTRRRRPRARGTAPRRETLGVVTQEQAERHQRLSQIVRRDLRVALELALQPSLAGDVGEDVQHAVWAEGGCSTDEIRSSGRSHQKPSRYERSDMFATTK